MKFKLESDLAKHAVAWLEAQRWDVYQEVQPQQTGRTADIVGICGRLVWVIETKLTLSLVLIEQAMRWREYSNYISICVPATRRGRAGMAAAASIMRHHGIGHIEIDQYGHVSDVVAPSLNRKALSNRFRDIVSDEHKTYAEAGTSSGHRWTPFQRTCSEIRRIVIKSPGICMSDLMKRLDHHYASASSAKSSISQYLRSGRDIIPGVSAERDGRYLRLFPAERKQ